MSENESTPETSTAEPVKRKRGRPPKARPAPDAEAPTLTLNERAPPNPAPDPVAEAPVAWLPRHLGYGGALVAGLAVLSAARITVPEASLTCILAAQPVKFRRVVGGLSV